MTDHAAQNRARSISDFEAIAAEHDAHARTFRQMAQNLRDGKPKAQGFARQKDFPNNSDFIPGGGGGP